MSMGSSSTKDSFPLGYKNFNQVRPKSASGSLAWLTWILLGIASH